MENLTPFRQVDRVTELTEQADFFSRGWRQSEDRREELETSVFIWRVISFCLACAWLFSWLTWTDRDARPMVEPANVVELKAVQP